jgi:hypothetical protein
VVTLGCTSLAFATDMLWLVPPCIFCFVFSHSVGQVRSPTDPAVRAAGGPCGLEFTLCCTHAAKI